MTATDYRDLDAMVLEQFDSRYPEPSAPAEVEAIETLYGRSLPDDVRRMVSADRPEALDPTPRELLKEAHPFEALILRVQEFQDTAALLFPLTSTVYVAGDLLGFVPPDLTRPTVPFFGWATDGCAYDIPSFLRTSLANHVLHQGDDEGAEELMAPIWGRVRESAQLAEFFEELDALDAPDRLWEAWGDKPVLANAENLDLVASHMRALFIAFALGRGVFQKFDRGQLDWMPDKPLADPLFANDMAGQLYWLWRSWLLSEDDALDKVVQATAAAKSPLVQDSRRIISELRAGRQHVGGIDYQALRRDISVWARDADAFERDSRTKERVGLQARLEPSEHGIALESSVWPLEGVAVEGTESEATRIEVSVTRETEGEWCVQQHRRPGDAQRVRSELPAPPEAVGAIPQGVSFATLHPDKARVLVQGTTLREESGEQVGALLEHRVDEGTWRVIAQLNKVTWGMWLDDTRWVVRAEETFHFLEMESDRVAPNIDTVECKQPRFFVLPDLGVIITYGSSDLANGRPVDHPGAPWVRVIAWSQHRLEQIAAFPIDAVALVAERDGERWRVGLVSSDRTVAWEITGLTKGVRAWRSATQQAEEASDAKRKYFGKITVERVVHALNTFHGTDFSQAHQTHFSHAYSSALEQARADESVRKAAHDAPSAMAFAPAFKGIFVTALMSGDPSLLDFSLRVTRLDPDLAAIGVRTVVEAAWDALRNSPAN
ncbi:MAG: hypothetical protein JKY37_01655 [Nannocystaceae bacterium]|nr:hypothetical protein [Nannocystaceae bacterium]